MDNDYPLVHSPLEGRVTRDGVTVEILIYRSEDESDWILEVVDEQGGSTVWDDSFPSDQAAYNAAMATIAEEGIGSFGLPEPPVLH